MYYLYTLTNTVSGTIYYGISKNPTQRFYCHKWQAVRKNAKSPLMCAMRSYGADAFSLDVVAAYDTREAVYAAEVAAIAKCKAEGIPNYNLHPGGSGGFSIREKSTEEYESIIAKMRVARAGRTPALGMKHTEENKKLFGAFGRLRWDIHGRYPDNVTDLSFIEANKKYGISKTHYYRLRKQRNNSDVA